MKQKRLADYLELMKSAREREAWAEVKRLGETALKKPFLFHATPTEKYLLYHRLGVVCRRSKFYQPSQALDVFYKSYIIASKHHLKPEYLASAAYNLGVTFRELNNINQALRYLQKVEEYYQKYGYKKKPMDASIHIQTYISLALCYLEKNELTLAQELIEDKIPAKLSNLITKETFYNYYHLKGDFLIKKRVYAQAREFFQKMTQIDFQTQNPPYELGRKTNLAVIDILEGKVDNAVNILSGALKEAGRVKENMFVCEISLLLSKCYRFNGQNDKADFLERRIKTIVARMDPLWFYELTKRIEAIYRQLEIEGKFSPAAQRFSRIFSQTDLKENFISFYQDTMVGKSRMIQEVYQLIEKVAPTDLPILIYGETGTGKELVARAIHQKSLRSRQTWLACNTGAIPETLLESELFGYVRGAFTGAQTDKKGYVELASGGTLFLDEVGSMSLGMQQKLLRVMEDNQLWRVGAEKEIQVNTRFVFASNENLEELVKAKRFREDLLYRINTIIINLPPLRERKEDIPLLVQYFLKKYALPRQVLPSVSSNASALLTAYSWPGNVRELENEIKRICILYSQTKTIEESMLAESIREHSAVANIPTGEAGLKEMRKKWERNIVIQVIQKNRGNINQTARQLKLSRRGLYKKLKQLEITL